MKSSRILVALLLAFPLLCGCTGNSQTPECDQCGLPVAPMFTVADGVSERVLCGQCWGWEMYKWSYGGGVKGICFSCGKEEECRIKGSDDQYKIVCEACTAYWEENGQ